MPSVTSPRSVWTAAGIFNASRRRKRSSRKNLQTFQIWKIFEFKTFWFPVVLKSIVLGSRFQMKSESKNYERSEVCRVGILLELCPPNLSRRAEFRGGGASRKQKILTLRSIRRNCDTTRSGIRVRVVVGRHISYTLLSKESWHEFQPGTGTRSSLELAESIARNQHGYFGGICHNAPQDCRCTKQTNIRTFERCTSQYSVLCVPRCERESDVYGRDISDSIITGEVNKTNGGNTFVRENAVDYLHRRATSFYKKYLSKRKEHRTDCWNSKSAKARPCI